MGEGGDIVVYPGADYGLDPDFGSEFSAGFSPGYGPNAGNIGIPTDPRTANQLAAIAQKLSTGAKTIEVSGVQAQQLESVPKQHMKEINRLKKLVGVDLTFHGPVVEASGWTDAGWTETNRAGTERQMNSAIERAHELEPDGNIVVTFHSSAGLPELETKVKTKDGEKVTEMIVFDERTGSATRLRPKINYLTGQKADPKVELEEMNKEGWLRELSQLSFHANTGENSIKRGLRELQHLEKDKKVDEKALIDIYKKSKTGEWQDMVDTLKPEVKEATVDFVNNMNYGEIYVRDAYQALQTQFNKAWVATEKAGNKEDKQKLENYKAELARALSKTDFSNPNNLIKFADTVQRGVNVLNTLKEAPKLLRPMSEFINDKSSETFANTALNAYEKFGSKAPIISIENPPAGGALSRASDLKKLVETTRKKFAQKAQKEMGLSEGEAKKQAEKLIGVTWDVGHINMIRKYGYGDKELKKETEKVAPFVKHVHLSDNFGMEHTELPMGMGDVPMKAHLEALKKYGKQVDKIKQIAETGNWFGPQAFGNATPFGEVLKGMGSSVFTGGAAPYWNQAYGSMGGYYSGFGNILPDQHFASIYGAGFSNLPTELGGQQMSGRSRMSGTPME